MPTIFQPEELAISRKGNLEVTILANRATLHADALQVERVKLANGASTEPYEASEAERFLYVIRGRGTARAGDQDFRLEPESVFWIEKGDAFSLAADSGELEVLLCRAPAGE